MHYMALIYRDYSARKPGSKDDQEMWAAYGAFTQDIIAKGHFKSGDALQPASTATCVSVGTDGKIVTTDGPFAETKEQLGGYYILDCADLDEAISVAANIPDAKGGKIEIRPVLTHE